MHQSNHVDALTPARLIHGDLHDRYTQGPVDGTVVDELTCDPSVGHGEPGYRVANAWLVVEL